MENISIDLLLDGVEAYEEEDYKRAFELFSQACEMGYARAYFNLGAMHEYGRGVQKDISKAIELYTKACEMGCTEACFNLGVMYEFGNGVQQDFAKAAEFYKKACDGGYARGCEHYTKLNQGQ